MLIKRGGSLFLRENRIQIIMEMRNSLLKIILVPFLKRPRELDAIAQGERRKK
jgi:hypothetical protein